MVQDPSPYSSQNIISNHHKALSINSSHFTAQNCPSPDFREKLRTSCLGGGCLPTDDLYAGLTPPTPHPVPVLWQFWSIHSLMWPDTRHTPSSACIVAVLASPHPHVASHPATPPPALTTLHPHVASHPATPPPVLATPHPWLRTGYWGETTIPPWYYLMLSADNMEILLEGIWGAVLKLMVLRNTNFQRFRKAFKNIFWNELLPKQVERSISFQKFWGHLVFAKNFKQVL